MRLYYLRLLALLLLFASPLCAQTTITLTWQGRARTYVVYLPPNYNPAVKIPLVLACHPGLSNAANHASSARWQVKGSTENFISVYPNGTSTLPGSTALSWNAYLPSTGTNVDDVVF
jgi:poly(3-hydroxybutyrate) depolymerase